MNSSKILCVNYMDVNSLPVHHPSCRLHLSLVVRKPAFLCPNFEKVGDILVSACPYVCVCVCVRMWHRDIVLKLHVWIPHGKIADAYFWFSLNYLPLLNDGPLTNKGMKFCKCRISKSIIARNLKLVMLIGGDD